MPRDRSWLLVAIAVGLAARLAFSLLWWVDKPLTIDEQEYVTLGRNLAAGRGLVYDDDGREHFGRAPGYPAFLAAIELAGGGDRAARVAQSVAGAATVPLVAALAAAVGGPLAGTIAAGVTAIHPLHVSLPAYHLSEALYSFLALAAAVLFGRALADRSTLAALAAGLVTGLATLVRPAALPWLAVAVVVLASRRRLGAAATLSLGAVLVIAPWAAFETLATGRFVLVASEGGITLWTGNNPLAIGEGDMGSNPAIKAANEAIRAAHPGLDHDALEPVYQAEALRFVREEPLAWLALEAKKLFYLFVPIGPSYLSRSALYLGTTWLTYLPLLALAVLGLPRVVAAGEAALPLATLALSVVAIALVFSPQERFRLPVLDPVAVACAATFLAARSARTA